MLHFMTEDILMNVIEYVDIEDRPMLRQTCLHMNAETRKKVGYLRLNEHYSREYLSNVAFREEVLQSIANPKKQLCLVSCVVLQGTIRMKTTELCAFKQVHALDTSRDTCWGPNADSRFCEIIQGKMDNDFCFLLQRSSRGHTLVHFVVCLVP
jgi:hypothetical protein